jgi:hypothetical protein
MRRKEVRPVMPEKAIRSIMKRYRVSHAKAEEIWGKIKNKRRSQAKRSRAKRKK